MKTPGVLETTKAVIDQAQSVRINRSKIAELCAQWSKEPFATPPWDEYVHMTSDDPQKLANYILVLDCLNFCFWPDPGQTRWQIEYKGQLMGGYQALAASLKRAAEEGIPITDAAWLAQASASDLRRVFRGQGEIPLMERRVFNVNEVGNVLSAKYRGQFAYAIESCRHSAVDLVELLAREFSSFNDIAVYKGRQVRIFKRTQITVVDLFGSFHGQGLGRFDDISALTAYADYKIPQVMRALGILEYAPELAAKVDAQELLPPGSEEEVEIRASMIWAVEYICRELSRLGAPRAPYELDWFLWNLGQRQLPDERPYHRTRTYFY